MGKKRKLPDGSTQSKETTPEKNDKKMEIDGDWVEDDDINDQLTKAESDGVEVEQSDINDQLNKAMTEGNGGEIVPFKPTVSGLALPLIPKGTGCKPQVEYSKVVLVQYSEEERLKDLEAVNNIKKKFKAEQVDKHSGENIHKIKNETGTGNTLLLTKKAESDWMEVEQSDMNDQLNKAMTEGNGGEIVPLKPTVSGLALPLISEGTGCKPQVEYSKIVLVKYSEEERLKDLEAVNNIKKKFAATSDMSLAMEYSKAEMTQEKGEENEEEDKAANNKSEDSA